MLYALGSNGSGQLGIGHTQDVSDPQPILIEGNVPPWKVRQLAAGGSHTVILCDDGSVRVAGDNYDGRLGLDGINQVTHFTDLPLPIHESSGERIRVIQAAAGWECTFLLTSQGEIYVCGTGNGGELGLGDGLTNSKELQRIPLFGHSGSKAVLLAAGMGHAVAVLTNGELWGWGKGRNGQLGSQLDSVWQPRLINGINFLPVALACGKDFTIVADEQHTGNLAILGGARHDKFGIKAGTPTQKLDWHSIAASWGSGYVLQRNGQLLAWGRNDKGQRPPSDIEKIKGFAAGSEHCVALLNTGAVAAWGWSEHGNCSTPVDADGDVKGRYNSLNVSGQPSRVFAGCATSFVETDVEVKE